MKEMSSTHGTETFGHNKKRTRLTNILDQDTPVLTSSSRTSTWAAALEIVLQHWLVPDLEICMDGLESRHQPLCEQLLSSTTFQSTDSQERMKEKADKDLHKWRSPTFISNRITKLSEKLENVNIMDSLPQEYQNRLMVRDRLLLAL